MSRILIVSNDGDRLRRLERIAAGIGFSVLKAKTLESAQQFVGVVPLDVAVADAAFESVLGHVQRNHPGAALLSISAHLNDESIADRVLFDPVDLFVFEEALRQAVDLEDASVDETAASAEPIPSMTT